MTMKQADPTNSPNANAGDDTLNAEYVEKRSDAPFPKAAKVTPETDSDKFSASDMYARFGQKKSEA